MTALCCPAMCWATHVCSSRYRGCWREGVLRGPRGRAGAGFIGKIGHRAGLVRRQAEICRRSRSCEGVLGVRFEIGLSFACARSQEESRISYLEEVLVEG